MDASSSSSSPPSSPDHHHPATAAAAAAAAASTSAAGQTDGERFAFGPRTGAARRVGDVSLAVDAAGRATRTRASAVVRGGGGAHRVTDDGDRTWRRWAHGVLVELERLGKDCCGDGDADGGGDKGGLRPAERGGAEVDGVWEVVGIRWACEADWDASARDAEASDAFGVAESSAAAASAASAEHAILASLAADLDTRAREYARLGRRACDDSSVLANLLRRLAIRLEAEEERAIRQGDEEEKPEDEEKEAAAAAATTVVAPGDSDEDEDDGNVDGGGGDDGDDAMEDVPAWARQLLLLRQQAAREAQCEGDSAAGAPSGSAAGAAASEPCETRPAASSRAPAAVDARAVTTRHEGTQVRAEGLSLRGVGILHCVSILAVFACLRCRAQHVASFTPGARARAPGLSVRCERCGAPLETAFRPSAMHEASNVLGYFDLSRCALFDVLLGGARKSGGDAAGDAAVGDAPELAPTVWCGTCLNCAGDVVFQRLAFAGSENRGVCRTCHSACVVAFRSLEWTRVRRAKPTAGAGAAASAAAAGAGSGSRRERDPLLFGVKAGTPLPRAGACVHYRRSRRWLRFPCCRRVFPCDRCHDSANTDGHEMLWATRMLCGMCSREQPVGDAPCRFCGAALARATSTHWEGGTGQRDRTKMARGDSRKHRGEGKTVSRKCERVGRGGGGAGGGGAGHGAGGAK